MSIQRDYLHEKEVLKQLEKFDTPSITNVVATYPADSANCLGLYHPWNGKWYSDQSLRCMYPELGRRAGYAVTCVFGMPDPNYKRLGLGDLLKAIDAAPKPVVVVIKQNMPDEIKNRNGLVGGNMMTAFKSLGAVGVISDGPSRDLDEIRPMEMQYMLTGVAAGHGDFSLEAVNVPVEICGMEVAAGDIVHMDENGAMKFPPEYLDGILERCGRLQQIESKRQKLMSETGDLSEIIKILTGLYD